MQNKYLLPLFVLSWLNGCVAQNIQTINNCTCQTSDGSFYSLWPFRGTEKPYFTAVPGSKYPNWRYAYNPCTSLTFGQDDPDPKTICHDIGICKYPKEEKPREYHQVGVQTGVSCALNAGQIELVYKTKDKAIESSIHSKVQLICDETASIPDFEPKDEDNYIFTIVSKCACPNQCWPESKTTKAPPTPSVVPGPTKVITTTTSNSTEPSSEAIHSSMEKQGRSSEDSDFTSTKVKSFASFRKSKGKEWKSRVTKFSKEEKKYEDVVVHLGLMEWNEKDQILKSKRGKRLPLRVSPNASYATLRQQAEEKWKTFHSNLYDESQPYHLLLEDGQKALLLPGSKKELFTLSRYQEELGKDFKRITFFLCPDRDFQISEGNFDEHDLTDFGDDDSDAPSSCNKRQKCEIDLTCNSDHKTSTQCSQFYQDQLMEMTPKLECEYQLDQDQKHECDQSKHVQQLQQLQQLEEDENLAFDLQRCYDVEDIITHEEENTTISDSSSVVTHLGRQVDESSNFFIVVRRGAPLDRTLSIWSREVKKNTGSTKKIVRVHFSGEKGIDSGAMAKEFFTITLPNIGTVIFPNGQPVDSTYHVHNGNFKVCGEIVAASIAQGGPAPCFLEESVYGLMADPNVPLQQLDSGKHLTTSDRELLDAIKEDIMAHTDTIIEHGYTGTVEASHTEEILSSVAISLVTKRLVYLKEFLNGLDSYGLKDIIQTHPEACKPLFVKNAGDVGAVDANYLFSSLHPEHANEGSSRRKVEEATMDLLQDFLFHLEDDPNINCSGYAEAMASCEDTGKEAAGSQEELLLPDLTPAGVLGWLTGQKHKPISGEQISITVKFDHDCLIRNPKHQICFPVVRACAKEVTFPIAHMKTQETFNEILMLALSKGQSFGMA